MMRASTCAVTEPTDSDNSESGTCSNLDFGHGDIMRLTMTCNPKHGVYSKAVPFTRHLGPRRSKHALGGAGSTREGPLR